MKKVQTKTFVKKLASTDRKTRDHALETLKKFLGARADVRPLTLPEFEKLWKGLYYTMWFSDRPRPQQRLADDLARLFSECVSKEQFCVFVQAFWAVVCKEWPTLDQWRVDKFYLLMRYVVRECFVRLQKEEWDLELLERYIQSLEADVLSGRPAVPPGVTYHVVDVYLDELERVVAGDEEDVEAEKAREKFEDVPLAKLLQPFEKIHKDALMKTLRNKVRDDLLKDERLKTWGYAENKSEEKEEDEEEEEEEWTGFD
ncbi:hypothetical protein KL921_001149 [Ogataea angusta]|uniref:Rrp1p n=1 Tax=Pichia angusta TaxID=870730 RepID=A0ABQ7S3A5_PICAN|nr:hypothetical protein KL921_001149 [Ogataea angusta]KAG7826067.1 hypothetical protein KL909_000119 [Ogataea angusta]KAG7843426.1 hypothetical protein KL942_000522 [Ogataea angusta]KAG7851643.1 hypothetical protein KL941_001312 [Ogataea angusta]KAG7852421.1 hypothetical protein KL940_000122 [Ogataea angusta]